MKFSAGSVLARGLTVFFQDFISFTVLSLIIHAPVIVYAAIVASEPTASSLRTFALVGGIAGLIMTAVTVGAVTYGVFQQLRGARASIGQCIAAGLGRVLSVIGVSIATGLAVIGVIIVPSVVAGFLAQGTPIVAVLVTVFPALLIISVLWVAVPATVVERIGPMASLNRSAELTRGRRGSVFLVLCALAVLTYGTNWIVIQLGQTGSVSTMTLLVGSQLVAAIETGLTAVTTAVGYHDLRVSHEGIGTEDFAKVFD